MNLFKAISLKLVSALLFAFLSAFIRYLGETGVPVGQSVFFRSAFAIIPVVLIYAWRRELMSAVVTSRPLGHLGRGAISVAGMFLNFAALARLPLVDATAISFAAPLITVAFAAWFLGERVRIYRWSAVAVGFIGVVVMLWPYLEFLAIFYRRRGRAGGDARRDLRADGRLHQRRLGGADPPAHRHRDDLVDRVLFLAVLRAGRPCDPAVRLGLADRLAACGADRRRPGRRHRRTSS